MNQSKIWSKSLKASEGTINIMIPDKEANGYFFVGLTSPYQWKGLSSRQHQWSGRPSSTKSEFFFYIWWQWERLFCFIILKMQWERLFCFIIIKTQLCTRITMVCPTPPSPPPPPPLWPKIWLTIFRHEEWYRRTSVVKYKHYWLRESWCWPPIGRFFSVHSSFSVACMHFRYWIVGVLDHKKGCGSRSS